MTLDGLRKAYGDLPVLDGVSFTVGRGEFVAVVGPSGCGKSTLFDVVAGLEPPDGGRVLVDDVDVTGRTDAFAYMPQQDLLFPQPLGPTTATNSPRPTVNETPSSTCRSP